MALSYDQNPDQPLTPLQRKGAIAGGLLAYSSPIGSLVAGKERTFSGGLFRRRLYELPVGGKAASAGKEAVAKTVSLPKMTGLASWGIGSLMGGAGIAKGIWEGQQELRAGSVSYYGNAPALDYDASANVDRTTGARTLGADGQLVFGLNSARHGSTR